MNYTISNEQLTVTVRSMGAELSGVKSVSDGYEYLWQGDPSVWSGQSPVLFPIVGRVLDDRYRLNGREYPLPKHGFFRKREAQLVYIDRSTLIMRQTEDENTLAMYPYRFELYVRFTLTGNRLTVNHRVVNANEKKMLFSLGAHPAFRCAMGDTLRFEEKETLYTEQIDADAYRLPGRTLVLDDSDTITITEHIFDNDALIMSGVRSENVTLHNSDGKNVVFHTGRPPYLGIWAKPGAPYVCIEPWYGIDDAWDADGDFTRKHRICTLAAGEEFVFPVTITIQ